MSDAQAATGMFLRGYVKRIVRPSDRSKFGNVAVETYKSDGEPKWERLAFVQQRSDGTATRIAQVVDELEDAEFIEAAIEVNWSDRKGTSWLKAVKINRVTVDAEIPTEAVVASTPAAA